MIIGLKTVQTNGTTGAAEEETGGADLEIETATLIEEKGDASSARKKVIRHEIAIRKEAEITEMAAMVEIEDTQDLVVITRETGTEAEETEAIHLETEGEAETEAIQETEGEEESTRDDPSLTTAETATTVAELTRAESTRSQDPHPEGIDTTTTKKEQTAAQDLKEDIIAAETEMLWTGAEIRAPTSRSVTMSRSSQETKEKRDLSLNLRAALVMAL